MFRSYLIYVFFYNGTILLKLKCIGKWIPYVILWKILVIHMLLVLFWLLLLSTCFLVCTRFFLVKGGGRGQQFELLEGHIVCIWKVLLYMLWCYFDFYCCLFFSCPKMCSKRWWSRTTIQGYGRLFSVYSSINFRPQHALLI